MDVANMMIGATAPLKTAKVADAGKPATTQGNSLPDLGQVRVPSGKPQDGVSASQLNTDKLNNIVEQANEALKVRSSDLKFSVAEGTNINIVRIEDSETGELIRQIPSEQMVAIAKALDEMSQGTMLKEEA